MGQAYHFHEGEVTFSSQFYDTTTVEVMGCCLLDTVSQCNCKSQVWLSHDQNMNESSIWWGTVYGEMNKYTPVIQGCIFAKSPEKYTPLHSIGKHNVHPSAGPPLTRSGPT